MNIPGKDAIEKARSFVYNPAVMGENDQVITPAESKEDVKVHKAKFAELCSPQKNMIIERHKFNSRFQKPGESFQAFVAELKTLVKTCEFDKLTPDQLVRDRIVCGVRSNRLRETLLNKRDLTLGKAIQTGQVAELTSEHSKTLTAAASATSESPEVHAVGNKQKQRTPRNHKPKTAKVKTTKTQTSTNT